MNDVHINILINNCGDIDTINSLRNQTFQNITVFLINNSIKNIDKFIRDDSRFVLVDETKKLNDVIKQINDGYVIICNSGDIFVKNAIQYITQTAYLTDADVINFSVKPIQEYLTVQTHRMFHYIFHKHEIMNHVFDYTSCFCIKHDILKKLNLKSWSFLSVVNILKSAKDITVSDGVYVLQQKDYQIAKTTNEYKDIVNYYTDNKNFLPYEFWKKYFAYLIPKITRDTMINNDKNTFIYCAKNINRKFVPLKYKTLFFIMRVLN